MDLEIDAAVSVILKLLRGLPLIQEEADNRAFYLRVKPIDNGMHRVTIRKFQLKLRRKLINFFKGQLETKIVIRLRLEIGPGDRMDPFVRKVAREVRVPKHKLEAMMPCVIWMHPTSVLVYDMEYNLIWNYQSTPVE